MIVNENSLKDYLSKKELIEMADIMSDAFVNHSNFIYIIKRENKRKQALYYIFLMMYKIINKYGFIYTVKEKKETIGYITFMDSADKAQISFIRILKTRGLFLIFKFFYCLKFSEIKELIKYIRIYNKYQKTDNKESKIHLYSTGVKNSFKGKGCMGKAIRTTYPYFKNLGYKKMVLETADLSNIPIYEKLGFKIVETVSTKDKQQTICFMIKVL